MSEVLDKALIQVIQGTAGTLEKGVKFSMDTISKQAPELMNQVVHYTLAVDIFWMVVSIFWIVGTCEAFNKVFAKDSGMDTEFLEPMVIILGSITGFIALVCILACSVEILQIIFAPKVFMIEYVSNLVKTVR